MLKKALKASFIGIAIAVLIGSIIMMIIEISNGGSLAFTNYRYTKMFFGCIGLGLGFGLPSLIYGNDRVPYPLQVVFHMGIGCTVMLIIGFSVGWIPQSSDAAALSVLFELAAAFIIWFGLTRHYKKEADSINQRLQKARK